MRTQSLTQKIVNNPHIQIVLSSKGEPSFLQIPWKVVLSLTEGELETLEMLSDPWWGKELPKRIKALEDKPRNFLRGSVSLDEYRAKKKRV